jgi:hypothetical protein
MTTKQMPPLLTELLTLETYNDPIEGKVYKIADGIRMWDIVLTQEGKFFIYAYNGTNQPGQFIGREVFTGVSSVFKITANNHDCFSIGAANREIRGSNV